jgi:hypothetical protein
MLKFRELLLLFFNAQNNNILEYSHKLAFAKTLFGRWVPTMPTAMVFTPSHT